MAYRGLRIGNHPVHPALTDFPIGLIFFTLVWDIIALTAGGLTWWTISFYTMLAGVIMMGPAAVTGLLDYVPLVRRRDPALVPATVHMLVNVSALGLFIGSLIARGGSALPDYQGLAIVFSWIGIVVLGVGGWLGGHMVFRYGVGQEPIDQATRERMRERIEDMERRRAA